VSASGNPTEEELEHVTEDRLEGAGATARERDLRDLWEHTMRCDHEVANALVVIAEHAAGVTTTGPLCPAIATVLVFVARNAGRRAVEREAAFVRPAVDRVVAGAEQVDGREPRCRAGYHLVAASSRLVAVFAELIEVVATGMTSPEGETRARPHSLEVSSSTAVLATTR